MDKEFKKVEYEYKTLCFCLIAMLLQLQQYILNIFLKTNRIETTNWVSRFYKQLYKIILSNFILLNSTFFVFKPVFIKYFYNLQPICQWKSSFHVN